MKPLETGGRVVNCVPHIMYVGLIVTLLVTSGCSNGAPRVYPPTINGNAGESAVITWDSNQDGWLSESELDACPALRDRITHIDHDGDGRLSAAEIDACIDNWQSSQIALMQVNAVIRLDGRPLSDADVTLQPEGFLGEDVQPAHGKTNPQGTVTFRISDEMDGRGVHLGWYKAIVTKKNGAEETIPARYNTNSELGLQVAPESAVELMRVKWDLESK